MARSRRGAAPARSPVAPARRPVTTAAAVPPAKPAVAAPAPAPVAAAPATATVAAPAPAVPAPMQQPSSSGGGGMFSGIGSTIAQGMAFGTGSAIAHHQAMNNNLLDNTESMEDSSMMEEEIPVPAALKTEIRCLHSAVGAAIATEPPFRTQVCFTLTAGQLQEEKRAAVDIVVALDVSGSMNGTKLQLCKRTLQQLLRLLSSEDRFGLVTYASTAKLSCPLRKMTAQNKATALSIIQSLTTRDSTNISSAICLAFQELRTLEGPNTIQTVFLLTDGQANGGITTVSELENFTKSCIRGPASTIPVVPEKTLSMHCFGYGSNHDKPLLSTISAAASGSYYNIDEDSAVDRAFGAALGGIMSTGMVAQSATATFRLHPDAVEQGTRIVKIHHNEVIDREDGSFSVNVGDIYAEETRDVLLELQLEPTVVEKGVEGVPQVIASVAYSNVSQKIPVQGPEQIVSIQRTEGTECSTTTATTRVLEIDDLLRQILSYVPNTFRYTATVNQQFYQSYLNANEKNSYVTSYESAVQTVATAEIWLEDYNRKKENDKYQKILSAFISAAAFYGRVPVLEFLKSKRYALDESVCTSAASGGQLDVLKWARGQICPCPWNRSTCMHAARIGRLDILSWAKENGCLWDEWTCAAAAENGHLDILIWAREQGCPWHDWTCINAAKSGHLNILIWASEHGCPLNAETCEYAAKSGHLDVLKWARGHGCPWNEKICEYAAVNGHMDILIWATEHDCPWNRKTWEEICIIAARIGRLDVLIWARGHDCPWNEEICEYAAVNGHLDVLIWATEHDCPWNRNTWEEICTIAARIGRLDILIWARGRDCPWNEEICAQAAENGHLDVLIWAREHGCPWNKSTCDKAAENGHIDILIWAREHGCPWNELSKRRMVSS